MELRRPATDITRGAARGRVVDVKPGELRGGVGGRSGFVSPWLYGSGTDWSGTSALAGSWQQPMTGLASGSSWSHSWSNPLPSPYSAGAGLPSGQLSLAGGHAAGSAGGLTAAEMPSEAEVNETYSNFGGELQYWVPALTTLIDVQLLQPLIHELESSDRLWQQVLATRGWRLTHEAPQIMNPGIGPTASVQELSVFDRFLPRAFGNDPGAAEMWSRRQQLEGFLTHPSFEPSQRQYVVERLREWSQRGLANSMRNEWRPSDGMPTDAHILENLVIKMLNMNMEFASCFVSPPHAPPLAKHLGQAPVAYLRQVTDQSRNPRPAPHYEVVTLAKVWKFRPGNSAILEALSLLLHSLKRQHSKSFHSFPAAVKAAIEAGSEGRGFLPVNLGNFGMRRPFGGGGLFGGLMPGGGFGGGLFGGRGMSPYGGYGGYGGFGAPGGAGGLFGGLGQQFGGYGGWSPGGFAGGFAGGLGQRFFGGGAGLTGGGLFGGLGRAIGSMGSLFRSPVGGGYAGAGYAGGGLMGGGYGGYAGYGGTSGYGGLGANAGYGSYGAYGSPGGFGGFDSYRYPGAGGYGSYGTSGGYGGTGYGTYGGYGSYAGSNTFGTGGGSWMSRAAGGIGNLFGGFRRAFGGGYSGFGGGGMYSGWGGTGYNTGAGGLGGGYRGGF